MTLAMVFAPLMLLFSSGFPCLSMRYFSGENLSFLGKLSGYFVEVEDVLMEEIFKKRGGSS